MGDDGIPYADPQSYDTDLECSLDLFKKALTARYEGELEQRNKVWTPHGEEPPPQESGDIRDYIDQNKAQVPDWVEEVLPMIEEAIPLYDAQDLDKLADATNNIRLTALSLGFNEGVDNEVWLDDFADTINGRSGYGHDFTSWSGISGDAFEENFGKFVRPTLDHQAAIAANLFKLYSARIALISAARSSIISTIEAAKSQLNAGGAVDDGLGDFLFGVATGALAVTLAGVSLPLGFTVGAYAMALMNRYKKEIVEYDDPIETIVKGAVSTLRSVKNDLDRSEREWRIKVNGLQQEIADVSSAELELYDFTSGGGGGSSAPPAGGFDVNVEDVRMLSGLCSAASAEYEIPIKFLLRTEEADGQLLGRDNVVTAGDTDVKEIRDQLVSFLQTTCARYYEASSRLVDAANEYFDMEVELDGSLARLAEDLEPDGGDTVNEYFETEIEREGSLGRLAEDPDLDGSERSGTGGVDLGIEATERDSYEDGNVEELDGLNYY